MGHSAFELATHDRQSWNSGLIVGSKRPLRSRDIWAIHFFLDEHRRIRDRALFDLAIDSKLRGCDLVSLKIGDLMSAGMIRNRATIIQRKTGRPVQFEIMTEARRSLEAWLARRGGCIRDFVFPSRVDQLGHLSTRQYARIVDEWGYRPSVSTSANLERIRCAGRRPPSSTNRPAICGLFRSSLATVTSKTQFGISASTWTMR